MVELPLVADLKLEIEEYGATTRVGENLQSAIDVLEHQAARIAALEAKLAEKAAENERLLIGIKKAEQVANQALEATPPAPKVTEEEWREIEQAFQPRIRDGYTDVKVSKPGFWFVKGPGPAAAQEAGKP